MKIAYVVSQYPALSHTFILREVTALRALGVSIETFSVRAADRGHLLTPEDQRAAASTYVIVPPRVGDLLRAHAAALVHPWAYVQTLMAALRMRVGGWRAGVWQFFYFLEAILLWQQCRRRGIRHIHAHFANVASDVALLAADFGNRILAMYDVSAENAWSWSFTMHGPTEFYDVPGHRLAEKTRRASFVVCISEFCRSQLMALVDRSHWSKLEVVHCGVDAAQFPSPCRGLVEGPLNILCVGRLVNVKGQALLLEAAAELLGRGRNIHVTLVGEGPARAALVTAAAELHITEKVTFAGAVGQDHIGEYYGRADIFCLPSFAEGVPVVLMEAMAWGLPVVSSRLMGIPELVEDGRSGFLISPGRVDELAAALDRLVGAAALREEMGEAGRAKVKADFNLQVSAEALRGIFAGVGRAAAPRVVRVQEAVRTPSVPVVHAGVAR